MRIFELSTSTPSGNVDYRNKSTSMSAAALEPLAERIRCVVASQRNMYTDDLVRTGKIPSERARGMTVVEHSYIKHANREKNADVDEYQNNGGSCKKNAIALLRRILSAKAVEYQVSTDQRFGGFQVFQKNCAIGARFDKSGNFKGFMDSRERHHFKPDHPKGDAFYHSYITRNGEENGSDEASRTCPFNSLSIVGEEIYNYATENNITGDAYNRLLTNADEIIKENSQGRLSRGMESWLGMPKIITGSKPKVSSETVS